MNCFALSARLFLEGFRDFAGRFPAPRIRKGEVLELPLELPHAEAAGERRVDLARLECQRLLVASGAFFASTQAMQLFCDSNQHEAHIGDDGQQHLCAAPRIAAPRAASPGRQSEGREKRPSLSNAPIILRKFEDNYC